MIKIEKILANGKLLGQEDDAYAYYEMIHQLWLKQQGRTK